VIEAVRKPASGIAAVNEQAGNPGGIMAGMATLDLEDVRYGGPHPWQIAPWARLVRRALRYRTYTRWVERYCRPLTVKGIKRLDELREPAIFIANHASHLDSLVLFAAMPEHVKARLYFGAAQDRWFVKGKGKLELAPWYQSLVLGNFPIVRGGGSKSLEYAHWLLKQGCHVAIFPEGTRATGDRLGDFRHGVAKLALEANVPVVPVYLDGLRALRPKGQKHARPGPAEVEVLGPVRFGSGMAVPEVTQTLWGMMNVRHRAHQPNVSLQRAA